MPEYYDVEPDFLPILQGMALLDPPRERPLELLRNGTDFSIFGEPEPVREVRNVSIPASGTEIGALLYLPTGMPTGLMVFYHGGGWVMGSLESHDRGVRTMVNQTGIAVLSVDYRMAPEHPFPVPFEDCWAALLWAREHCADLAGRQVPILVGGDSAGGNLAAAVALAARDAGMQLAGQLLIYPALDSHCAGVSFGTRAECPILTSIDMRWYWDMYRGGQDHSADPRFAPTRAGSLSGLAPALVVVAGIDPLRDDGLDYATALARSDVRVSLLHFPRQPHGFFNFMPLVPSAARAFEDVARAITGMLA